MFSIPQKWADRVVTASNGALTEQKLFTFAHALFARVERDRIDVTTVEPNFLGWLDDELKKWRVTGPDRSPGPGTPKFEQTLKDIAAGKYNRG